MNRSFLGLADVVRLMPHAGSALPQWVAALDEKRALIDRPEMPPARSVEGSTGFRPALPIGSGGVRQPLRAPQYVALRADPWIPATELHPLDKATTDAAGRPLSLEFSPMASGAAPKVPIAALSQWWPALKRQRAARSQGLDVARWVRLLSVARWLSYPPRRQSLGAWTHLCVVLDVSYLMAPYLGDFEELVAQARRLALAQRLSVLRVESLNDPLHLPKDADAVLLLSDLGAASATPHATARRWLSWLSPARHRSLPLCAWVPAYASRISAELVGAIHVIPWHEGSRFQRLDQPQALAKWQTPEVPNWQPLLTRLAFTLDADPPMLRRLRRLCPNGTQHPEWEAMIWAGMQGGVVSSETVVQIRPKDAAGHRLGMQALSDVEQLALWECICAQRLHRPRSTLMAERLLLASHARPALRRRVQAEIDEARDWFSAYLNDAEAEANQVPGYVTDVLYRLGSDVAMGQCNEPLIARMGALGGVRPEGVSTAAWLRASQAHQDASRPLMLPWAMAWIDPGGANAFKPWIALKQGHEDARHVGLLSPTKPWTYADWASGRDALKERAAGDDWLVLADANGVNRWRVSAVQRESWQNRLGRDRCGVFSELLVQSLTLRLRYLPPGTFLMGSPDGEGGSDEQPQHPVTLTEGFWLAETPCTQMLWKAVMGNNPSHFQKGADWMRRPVENVSHEDVAAFLNKLTALLPSGVEAVLPTEAQWEYAARAGLQTAYWWGDKFDPERANTDHTGKKQYDDKEGTTPVDRYPPNPWGLYDMNGNVWEWCADGRRTYEPKAEVNPVGNTSGGAFAGRGGSWIGRPGRARAAFRFGRLAGSRARSLGFRFALRSSSPGPEGGA